MQLSAYELNLLKEPHLRQSTIQYFCSRYGQLFVRALRAVDEQRVLRYHFHPSGLIAWIVKGRRRDYLTIPDVYCSCRSFYQSVVITRSAEICYHLLAQKIAEIRKAYQNIESTDIERRILHLEWRRTD